MSVPYSLVVRLEIDKTALCAALASAGAGFDSFTDWAILPVILGKDLPQRGRQFDGMVPGRFLKELRSSAKPGTWLLDDSMVNGAFVCVDLMHSASWSALIVTLARLRTLPATGGYLLIHDFLSGSDTTHAAIGFYQGESFVLDLTNGDQTEMVADARQLIAPLLNAGQNGSVMNSVYLG